MSKLLEIPDQLFIALEQAARADGQTPADWIATRLPPSSAVATTDEKPAPKVKTMADALRGRLGGFKSGNSQLATKASEMFSSGMQAKKNSGHI